MKNTRMTWLAIVAMTTMIAAACTKDQILPPHPQQETHRGALLSVMDSNAYDCNSLADAVLNAPIFGFLDGTDASGRVRSLVNPALRALVVARQPVLDLYFARQLGQRKRQWQIETYVFTYETVDPSGKPIQLGGRVTFPNNTVDSTPHEVSTLSLVSHPYLEANIWAPYYNLSLTSIRCLYNSAVIEPDYQGYGFDYGKHAHTIFSSDVMGRQMANCAMAALKVMKAHDVHLAADGYATNWATSAGEPYALSFARYFDIEASNNERSAIPLHSTFVCEGLVDFEGILRFQDANPECNTFFTDYAMAILPIPSSAMHGYQASQFFPSWMSTTTIDYNGETDLFLNLKSRYNSDIFSDNYEPEEVKQLPNMGDKLAASMLDADGHVNYDSPTTKAFINILHENLNWDNWIPTTDIYMGNEDEDSIVPYEPARQFYAMMSQRCNKMHWLVIDNSASPLRNYTNVHYAASIEALLYMSLAHEPKDMRVFHREE